MQRLAWSLSVLAAIGAGCRDAKPRSRAPDPVADDGGAPPRDSLGDAATAPRLLWSQPDDGTALDRELGAAAFDDEVALLVSSKGTRAMRATDGAVLWRTTAELLHPAGVPRPLFEVHRDTDPVTLVALEPATGERGATITLPRSFNPDAALYLAGAQVFAVRDTSIRATNLDGASALAEAWTAMLDTNSRLPPVLTSALVVTRLPVVAVRRTDGQVAWRQPTDCVTIAHDDDHVAVLATCEPATFVRVSADGGVSPTRTGKPVAGATTGIALEDDAGLWRWKTADAAPTLVVARRPGEDFAHVALDQDYVYFFSFLDRAVWRADAGGRRTLVYQPGARQVLTTEHDRIAPPAIDAAPVPRGPRLYVHDAGGWHAIEPAL